MNGILCINKPEEYTSFDVVARIRGMSKTKKVGHSGTLDPMATGVLPVFLGTATKAIGVLPNDDKKYIAGFRLGETTDTLDAFGQVLHTCESHVSVRDITALLSDFRGNIQQLPPMYSAVRINGQRLYDIARQGREVERQPRNVTVYSLELLSFDEASQEGKLEIFCSKGTYIRTIISDLGSRLSVGGIMTELMRTEASGFSLADCITLEEAQQLTAADQLEEKLLATDRLFAPLPKIRLNPVQTVKFKNGVQLDLNRVHYKDIDGLHRVYGPEGDFLALARLNHTDESLRIEKTFFD